MSINLLDEVSFQDTAVGKNSKAEMEVTITGFVTGIKVCAGSRSTYKKYRISAKKPHAYASPKHYGWKKEEEFEIKTKEPEEG